MINDIEDLKECNHQLDLENQALRARFNEQQVEIERLKVEVADLTRDRNGWGDTAQMLEAKLARLRKR